MHLRLYIWPLQLSIFRVLRLPPQNTRLRQRFRYKHFPCWIELNFTDTLFFRHSAQRPSRISAGSLPSTSKDSFQSFLWKGLWGQTETVLLQIMTFIQTFLLFLLQECNGTASMNILAFVAVTFRFCISPIPNFSTSGLPLFSLSFQ